MPITGAYAPFVQQTDDPLIASAAPQAPAAPSFQAAGPQQSTQQQSSTDSGGMTFNGNPLDFFRDLLQGRYGFTRFHGAFDPNALLDPEIQEWLRSMGIRLQIKPSDNGIPSGRITLPNGQLVDLNVGGRWGWLPRDGGTGAGAGTGVGGAGGRSGVGGFGGFGSGGGYTNDQGVFTPYDPNLNPMTSVLRSTPGWQWAFGQGQEAALGPGTSRTLRARPNTLAALNQYGTGVADQTYGPQVQRYLSVADLGLRGATAPFI